MEKDRWEFTAFPELESLKAFKRQRFIFGCLTSRGKALPAPAVPPPCSHSGRKRNGVSKNPPPSPPKKLPEGFRHCSLDVPNGTGLRLSIRRNFCLHCSWGLFRRKDKFTKCELYPSKMFFYDAEKPFLGWKGMG